MPRDLLQAWGEWRPGAGWKCLSADQPLLGTLPLSRRVPQDLDWTRFVREAGFGADDKRLHLTLTPIPFLGNLETAKVVILLQNPGLSPTDYYGEFEVNGFRELLLRNLRGELRQQRYPFLFLDPELAWHGGHAWWHRKLGSVIAAMANALGMPFDGARRKLAKEIACIELVPYHSQSGVLNENFVERLPSAKLAKDYLHQTLIPRAQRQRLTIIAPRHVRPWGFASHVAAGEFQVPDGLSKESCVLYGTRHALGASLSASTPGGQAILLAMGVPSERLPPKRAVSAAD